MKNILFLTVILFSLVACTKDDDQGSKDPIDQLPPATQTGENTIGCLLNGKALLPKGENPTAFYQYVDGGYSFSIGLSDNLRSSIEDPIESVGVGCYTSIEPNVAIPLVSVEEGNCFGEFSNGLGSEDTYYSTTQVVKGELFITRLDEDQGIVSGTFWFDAVNGLNDTISVREGRFDLKYTN